MTNAKHEAAGAKNETEGNVTTVGAAGQTKRSWWYWRRSQGAPNQAITKSSKTDDDKSEYLNNISFQTNFSYAYLYLKWH